jgi:hypothetical protein
MCRHAVYWFWGEVGNQPLTQRSKGKNNRMCYQRKSANKRLQMSVTAVCNFRAVLSHNISCFVGVLARYEGR